MVCSWLVIPSGFFGTATDLSERGEGRKGGKAREANSLVGTMS